MKYTAAILLISFLLAVSLSAAEASPLTLSLSGDLSSLRSFFTNSLHVSGAILLGYGDISFGVPFTWIADRTGGEEMLIDTGLSLTIYPFRKGIFYSVSLFHLIAFIGPYVPETPVHTLNEMSLGYEITLFERWTASARIKMRDVSRTFTEEFDYIRGFIPGYSRFDAAIEIRYTAASFDLTSNDR